MSVFGDVRFDAKAFGENVLASLVAAALIFVGGWLLGHARQAALVAVSLPVLAASASLIAIAFDDVRVAKRRRRDWFFECRIAEVKGKPLPKRPSGFRDAGIYLRLMLVLAVVPYEVWTALRSVYSVWWSR